MNRIRILVVDDESDLLRLLVRRLNRKGYQAKGVTSGEEALLLLKDETFDIGIFDIRLGGMDGIQLLEKTKKRQPEMEVLMLTGHGTIETAIEAMKMGACDYLTKPYQLSELEVVIEKAFSTKRLREKNQNMKQLIQAQTSPLEIVGESEEMKKVLALVRQVADSEIPVAIGGETGTGKELFARALHEWSVRKNEPFVAVNGGALPEQLLESELFGHVKGAFTGAQQNKKGLVEVVDGGTLFLDELGEMPLPVQVKLLRFLESGEFRRVGDVRLRQVSVRVVAATNRDLEEEVKQGRFREDLYYRLNAMQLEIPPLRRRKEDLPLLVDHFLRKKSRLKGKKLSQKGMKALEAYDFPGNVRELFHILERGFLLAKGEVVGPSDLFPGDSFQKSWQQEEEICSLEELERRHMARVLEHTSWKKTEAAAILGISVRNLYRKIEQYELKPGSDKLADSS